MILVRTSRKDVSYQYSTQQRGVLHEKDVPRAVPLGQSRYDSEKVDSQVAEEYRPFG